MTQENDPHEAYRQGVADCAFIMEFILTKQFDWEHEQALEAFGEGCREMLVAMHKSNTRNVWCAKTAAITHVSQGSPAPTANIEAQAWASEFMLTARNEGWL